MSSPTELQSHFTQIQNSFLSFLRALCLATEPHSGQDVTAHIFFAVLAHYEVIDQYHIWLPFHPRLKEMPRTTVTCGLELLWLRKKTQEPLT